MIVSKHCAISAIRNSRHTVEKYYLIFGINKSFLIHIYNSKSYSNLTNTNQNGSVFNLCFNWYNFTDSLQTVCIEK